MSQPLALAQGLVDEGYFALLEVTQATVNQLRALRRRTRSEVVAFDQGGTQAARSGIQGDTGPGDAGTDHEDIEGFGGEALEHARSSENVGGHRPHPR